MQLKNVCIYFLCILICMVTVDVLNWIFGSVDFTNEAFVSNMALWFAVKALFEKVEGE